MKLIVKHFFTDLDTTANHDLDSVVAVEEDNSVSGRVQSR